MVNTAIIYQSKYGSTEKYAKWLYEEIGGDLYKKSDVSINDLKKHGIYFISLGKLFPFISNIIPVSKGDAPTANTIIFLSSRYL